MNSCLEAFQKGLAVKPLSRPSDYGDREVFIKKGIRWSTPITPYCERIMEVCGADSPANQIDIMKAQQLAVTTMCEVIVAQSMDEYPDNIIYQLPNGAACLKFSKTKLKPMLENTPALKNLVSDASTRDGTNTTLLKEFPGGTLFMLASNSSSEGRMVDARLVIVDEYDAHADEISGEGSGLKIIKGRTASKGDRGKVILASTPQKKAVSKIYKEFLKGSQEFYYVPCPFCKFKQVLKWENFKYEKGNVDSIRLKCINQECGALIEEKHKTWMMSKEAGAEWIAHNPNRQNKKHLSFHISAFYSPAGFLSWRDICQEWFDALEDKGQMITFKHLIEGWPYEDAEEQETQIEELISRRYKFSHPVPKEVLILTAFCDVQDDRLEVVTWGFGLNDQKWRIDKEVFMAPPTRKVDHPIVWEQLEVFRKKTYIHESGVEMAISGFGIDTGGHFADQAYNFVRGKYAERCFATKGNSQMGAPLVMRPTKSNKGKIPLHLVGTDTAKRTIFGNLRAKKKDENGYIHLQDSMSEEECKQILSERLRPKRIKNAKGVFENIKTYQKTRDRNEELDCLVGAYIVMKMLRPNFVQLTEFFKVEQAEIQTEDQVIEESQEEITEVTTEDHEDIENAEDEEAIEDEQPRKKLKREEREYRPPPRRNFPSGNWFRRR